MNSENSRENSIAREIWEVVRGWDAGNVVVVTIIFVCLVVPVLVSQGIKIFTAARGEP